MLCHALRRIATTKAPAVTFRPVVSARFPLSVSVRRFARSRDAPLSHSGSLSINDEDPELTEEAALEELAAATALKKTRGAAVAAHQKVLAKERAQQPTKGNAHEEVVPVRSAQKLDEDSKNLRKLFKRLDTTKSGQISRGDFQRFLAGRGVEEGRLTKVFDLLDSDRNGRITYEEFCLGMGTVMGGSFQDQLHYIFQLSDADNNQEVTREEFQSVIEDLFMIVTAHEGRPPSHLFVETQHKAYEAHLEHSRAQESLHVSYSLKTFAHFVAVAVSQEVFRTEDPNAHMSHDEFKRFLEADTHISWDVRGLFALLLNLESIQ